MRRITIQPSITERSEDAIRLYFKDVYKLDRVDNKKEMQLIKEAQKGDRTAIDSLIKTHLRFVISIAKQYQGAGLPLADLIQEGNLGLIEAIPKYDINKGFKFISFAVWWIRQSITKALTNDSRTIRVPGNQLNNYNKFVRNPDNEHKSDYGMEVIGNSIRRPASLDSCLNDGDSTTLLDIVPNKSNSDISAFNDYNESLQKVQRLLKCLTDREHDIIIMSLGIGVDKMSYEAISDYFGIGYERVRQLQTDILKKLRKQIKKNDLFSKW